MVQKLIDSGFTPCKEYNPVNGWLGCTRQHPDWQFTKGQKKVTLSLQGVLSGNARTQAEFDAFENNAVKYIELKDGGNKVYQNFFGIMPDNKTLNDFIYG